MVVEEEVVGPFQIQIETKTIQTYEINFCNKNNRFLWNVLPNRMPFAKSKIKLPI